MPDDPDRTEPDDATKRSHQPARSSPSRRQSAALLAIDSHQRRIHALHETLSILNYHMQELLREALDAGVPANELADHTSWRPHAVELLANGGTVMDGPFTSMPLRDD